MCGRFVLTATLQDIAAHYGAKIDAAWSDNYNITPSQMIPVVVERPEGREVTLMKWGLIPFWAKDAKIGSSLTNARADTIDEKPAFRDSFKDRRCIIPASGFYEWATFTKKTYYFTPKDGFFSFAGLWSRWISPDSIEVESCSIITTSANGIAKPIHNRMPVILSGSNSAAAWLHGKSKPSELKDLLTPLPDDRIDVREVSKYVNSAKNNGPQCIAPV